MRLVVGLGNPGEEYKNNRHNAGFIIIDELARKWDLTWNYNKRFNAEVATALRGAGGEIRGPRREGRGNLHDESMILIKPQTFMNNSGEAVSKALQYFGIDPSGLTVVHDDVDLEALQFKVSRNSSSAGHHGVQNIIDKIGTQDFTRLRVGVGRPPRRVSQQLEEVEKYVLQDFPSDQLEVVKKQGVEHLLSSLGL